MGGTFPMAWPSICGAGTTQGTEVPARSSDPRAAWRGCPALGAHPVERWRWPGEPRESLGEEEGESRNAREAPLAFRNLPLAGPGVSVPVVSHGSPCAG